MPLSLNCMGRYKPTAQSSRTICPFIVVHECKSDWFILYLPPPGDIIIRHVCWLVGSFVRLLVRSLYVIIFWTEYLENGWRYRLGFNTPIGNGIWRYQMVTCSKTSLDPKRSRLWSRYTWIQTSGKPLKIDDRFLRTTDRKLHTANRMIKW